MSDDGVTRRGAITGGAAALAALLAPSPRELDAQYSGQAPPRPPRGRDYIVEASWALVPGADGRSTLLRDASIRVREEQIVAVTSGRIRGNTPRIDARGMLLLPGFISGHTHAAAGSATRGIIEGGRSYQRPLELVEQLPDDALDALTAYNVAELLRSGCTSHVEMSLSLRQAQSYVRVARGWHVRGFPGGMVPGTARLFPIWRRRDDAVLRESVADTLAEIEANRRFALAINGAEDGLMRPMLTPHATDTHTPETMAAMIAAAREVGNGLHLHLAQGMGEVRAVERAWGERPVPWLESLGAFSLPVFGAHMTAATDEDWVILRRHGAVYAHCPAGGGNGASSGTQPYPEALAAGVRCNIGIDTHSNDYLDCLRQAVIVGRARARLLAGSGGGSGGGASATQNPARATRLPTIADAVDGATVIAADGLRRPDLGRITVGAKADLCAIDVSGLLVGSGAPGPEPLHNLLYAHGLAVRHVITNGWVQLLDGRLTVADERRVVREGAAVVTRLWDQLRGERWFG